MERDVIRRKLIQLSSYHAIAASSTPIRLHPCSDVSNLAEVGLSNAWIELLLSAITLDVVRSEK